MGRYVVGAQGLEPWTRGLRVEKNRKFAGSIRGRFATLGRDVQGTKIHLRIVGLLDAAGQSGPRRFHLCAALRAAPEINASPNEPLESAVVRSDNEAVVIDLDIEPAEKAAEVLWIDPIHKG